MTRESLIVKHVSGDVEKRFPSEEMPAILTTWTESRQRMGSAPAITGTIMYPRCIDSEWTTQVYVELSGEKYYLEKKPSSTKDSTDLRFKYELTFKSGRSVLDNVFFLDVVAQTDAGKYRSNSTKVLFSGDITEFVSRLNQSLIYSKVYDEETGSGYHIVIDDGISSAVKELSFEDTYLSDAIQEISKTYELNYYWVGETCHVGDCEKTIETQLEYGAEKALMSIQKSGTNNRLATRILGHGSSENIPYYYPNENPAGTAIFTTENIEKTAVQEIKLDRLINAYPNVYNKELTFCKQPENARTVIAGVSFGKSILPVQFMMQDISCTVQKEGAIYATKGAVFNFKGIDVNVSINTENATLYINKKRISAIFIRYEDGEEQSFAEPSEYIFTKNGKASLIVQCDFTIQQVKNTILKIDVEYYIAGGIEYYLPNTYDYFFEDSDGREIPYKSSGITFTDLGTIPFLEYTYTYDNETGFTRHETESIHLRKDAAKITVTGRNWIPPSQYLMPSIYRSSKGEERAYNAVNNKYKKEDGNYYIFANPYIEGRPFDYNVSFEDVKPTITGVVNSKSVPIDTIAGIAFDSNNNDLLKNGETDYIHGYFYIKLPKMDGEYGFNLFGQALESESAYINLTTGNCSACKFEIAVEKKTENGQYIFYNPVITDGAGNLKKISSESDSGYIGDYIDTSGNVSKYTKSQQDTSANEVWIAVKKDTSTFGVVMPNAANGYTPSTGDKFVLTGIKMPDSFVLAAEKRLNEQLIETLKEQNEDTFTFSIKFFRTYLASHPELASSISENVKLSIKYDGTVYPFYVSSFERKADDNILYEINVELSKSLAVSSSTLQSKLDSVKGDVLTSVAKEIKQDRTQGNFLRKDIDDTAAGIITLLKGAKFGHGGFQIDEEGKAKLARLLISDTGYGIDPTGVATLKDILTRQGITFGDFVTGLFGRGGRIDGEGNGEMRSLRLWDFLEVPELRYNRVSIYTGVEWHTNGGGIIESVTPDVTTATGVCKLKLEEGEIGAITAGDMCMGIFHNEGGTNETATTDARNGNFTFAGFCTVYFLIDETGYISDDGSFVADESRKEAFTYILRADDTWTAKHHPQAQMHFAQYAHATDKSRQSCRYSTTEYTIGLRNMTTWTYGTQNIYKIEGRLDGFSMQYYDFTTGQTETQQFSGYGVVFGDIWAKSIVTNSQLFNTLRMDISYAGQTTLDYGEELPVTFELCIQTTPISELPSFAGKTWVWTIQRNSGDAASDAVWNANAKALNFNANAGSSATLTIAFKEGDNDLGTASPAYSTIFTAKARLQGTEKTYEATINI